MIDLIVVVAERVQHWWVDRKKHPRLREARVVPTLDSTSIAFVLREKKKKRKRLV